MPTVTAGAELALKQGPTPAVNVYIDGRRAGAASFEDWRAAELASLELTDELSRVIRTVVVEFLRKHQQ